ncbi:PH domain-containing protein [Allokutzneria sp. A3M-2-11 16]|uniref:PH domain-containing protein n=1 Tax=Allokutzneria sp. A3M-2-11 16 TaxID=2962043 RepID=UPI0020B68256|nr:PH domain-containing protein [Allokutzneria sp. A3M-2-11 16]MCP3800452.1 PH domain-containing protein [Allokutzneria sp. A3M-2-11 16]
MAYPDDLLSDDEQVVVHKHPHWKMLFFPVIVLLVVVGGGIYLATLVEATDWRMIGQIGIAVVGGILLVWFVFAPFVRWRTTHFVVTTHRLMVREGVLKRTGIDLPMSKINSVRSNQSLSDRLFGCGTLVVESASDEPLEFDDIPKVEYVRTVLYRETNDDPNDDFAPKQAR